MEGDSDGIGHDGYGKRRFDRNQSKEAVGNNRYPDGDGLLKQPLIDQRFTGVEMAIAVGQERRHEEGSGF